MTPRSRKPWSKVIEAHGVAVRVYERAPGSLLYREVWIEGARDRKSLGHRDRSIAEGQARELATRLAELQLTGHVGGLTLGHLWRLYEHHRLPLLSADRQVHVRQYARFMLEHFGERFLIEDFGQQHVDSFAAARRSGVLRGKHRSASTSNVRDSTIEHNLQWLASMLAWARQFRLHGKRVLSIDPLEGLVIPRERNVRRPIMSLERYRALLTVASTVDAAGRFELLLVLARTTGRRVNALCQLRASDVLLSRDALGRALADAGLSPDLAEHMPHGALRFRAEHDKQGYEDIVPIARAARDALDRYLRAHPYVGETPLVPSARHPTRALPKMDARQMLVRAERLAKLPHVERGGWHAFRRLWAQERKSLPDVDVAKAGGWRSLDVMKQSYQAPDPVTTLRVVEHEPDRHTTATAPQRSADGSTA